MAQAERERQEAGEHMPRLPLLAQREEDCVACWACVRHCPARAIKIVEGRPRIAEERCVKCGLCVTECSHQAFSVRDDLPPVRSLLASGRPVVALVATEYIAALHPLTPDEIEQRLALAGFAALETTVLGEELVAAAYERVISAGDPRLPQLRSTCPVVVDWVRRFYPELTSALAPIVPPYVAQARLIRSLYPSNTAIVYVSPCWARKDEIFEDDLAGEVDVAIGFDELKRLLDESPQPKDEDAPVTRPRAAKQLSVTDGFPRRALTERDLTDGDVAVVRGLEDVDRLLAAVSRGETAPAMVDMLNCEGCIDGPCVRPELSVFVKRGIDAAERRRQAPPLVDSRAFLSALPTVELTRAFVAEPAGGRAPTEDEVDEVLAGGEFASRDETIDCGACGYRTCVSHAVAIWEGSSTWEMCFPLQKRRLIREREALAEAVIIDTLTGLMNRRGFDRRLSEEFARSKRYDTPVSLVMMDLDAFKEINDQHGHPSGDALLRAVGVLLSAELRTADVAVRFGGDEFALILPNTPKTDAWAVAEKVRNSISQLTIHTEDGATVG
ncbi:MAG TPA: diguanylate cyclase, partial [Coriobacteriia bacterium]|nr:diguanylate cyclase [Coriobacteriia bacterium]